MKNLYRQWGFPIVLLVSWVLASAYTVSHLVDANQAHVAAPAGSPRT